MTQINKEQAKKQIIHKDFEEVLSKVLEEEEHISWYDRETLLIGDVHYKMINNFREAFDIEQFKERYIDYLSSFDYIVGDVASEKLRLRGFYDENREKVRKDQWITRLDDYLIEYCNFGAPYFVLERVDKLEEIPTRRVDKESENKQRNRRNSRKRRSRRRQNQRNQRKQKKHTFKKEIRQIKTGNQLKKEEKKTSKNVPPKKHFKIRPVNEK